MKIFIPLFTSITLFGFGLNSCIQKSHSENRHDLGISPVIKSSIQNQFDRWNADSVRVLIFDAELSTILLNANYSINNNEVYETPLMRIEYIEPASLIKPYWAGLLLQNELVGPNDSILYESNKNWNGMEIMDAFKMPFNYITLSDAVRVSSNTAMANFLTSNSSNQNIQNEYYRIQFPKDSSQYNLALAAIGQGIQVSEYELLEFYGKIAQQKSNSNWSLHTLKQLEDILISVVENGTGKNLHSDTIQIAGKTATFRELNRKDDAEVSEGRFIGYCTMNPKYIVLVRVFNPFPMYYGSVTAGPIALDILKHLK